MTIPRFIGAPLLFVITTSVYIFIHCRPRSHVGLITDVRLHLLATKSALHFPRYTVRSNSSEESSSIDGYHLDNIDSYIHGHQTAQSSWRHYHHCPVFPSGTNSLIFVLQRQKIWLIYMHFVHKLLVQVKTYSVSQTIPGAHEGLQCTTVYILCLMQPCRLPSVHGFHVIKIFILQQWKIQAQQNWQAEGHAYLWHNPLLHLERCLHV